MLLLFILSLKFIHTIDNFSKPNNIVCTELVFVTITYFIEPIKLSFYFQWNYNFVFVNTISRYFIIQYILSSFNKIAFIGVIKSFGEILIFLFFQNLFLAQCNTIISMNSKYLWRPHYFYVLRFIHKPNGVKVLQT